ncbi:MAG TPA: hypothetical protein DHW34_04960 [Actinobacteria bacterium]|nr:hypothetical protein [Actinomycetota bacterium]
MSHDDAKPQAVEIHHAHRDVTGGWLRPAVFGAMDGLVSNAALMAGVAGGVASSGGARSSIVLAGFAGLAAGAFSMAAGEYVSVRAQSESALAEIESERRELAERPEAELAELIESYVARGVARPLATDFATAISADPEQALAVHIRDEVGIHPDELPSPWVAGSSSFAAFAVGAFVPLLPYLLGLGTSNAVTLAVSQALAVAALFACGAMVSRVTTRGWLYSGVRQAAIGVFAGLLTYALGHLAGSAVG